MSYLGDKYDVEAFSRGMANAVIQVKGEKHDFNHTDKIFESEYV